MKGTLYIVSTPIGNLEDITLRALRILKEVDIVAAEDTRHSLKLLTHFGIRKPLVSYWGEKEKLRAEETLQRLQDGQSVALISDAGTPGIADPGTLLIRRAIDEGIRIVPVPGVSAVITALSMAGFSADRFLFKGFLPPKERQRKKVLDGICLEEKTVVFYEAPHRILDAVGEIAAVMSDRQIVVIKELTKVHEEVLRGTASDVYEALCLSTIAGEYVVVISGRPERSPRSSEDALKEVRALMKKGLGRKESVKKIADEYGLSKKELYDRSLEGH